MEVETKRNQLGAQRIKKIEDEQTRLARRLEEIVNEPILDDYEDKLKLIKKRKELEER